MKKFFKILLVVVKIFIYLFITLLLLGAANNSGYILAFPVAFFGLLLLYGVMFNRKFLHKTIVWSKRMFIASIILYILSYIYRFGFMTLLTNIFDVIKEIIYSMLTFLAFIFLIPMAGAFSFESKKSVEDIQNDINQLEMKRNGVRTRNTLLDEITGDTLSESKLKHNQRYYDKLTDDIDNLKKQIKDDE